MTDHDRRPPRHPDRWPLALPLAAALTAAGAATLLAIAAPTGRGDPQPTIAGTTEARDRAPGRASRLDPEQLRRGEAQAVADRFATQFAAYLNGTVPAARLRRAGATRALVQRITTGSRRGPKRATPGGLRSTGVVVRADRTGWLATALLESTSSRRASNAPGVPLSLRLEHVDGRVVVVDVNAGGGE